MILLVGVDRDREYLLAPGETLETDLGIIEVPEDVACGEIVETHLGEAFRARTLRGPDLFAHFERTGAPMMPRDIGLVMGHTGLSGGDRVLDAGTGTGVLSAYLARAGASVITYEINPEFADVARENMEMAGVSDAVEIRTGNVTEALEDGDLRDPFDLITLDTEDAPQVVEQADELLARGGFLAAYVPFVEGTRAVVEAARTAELQSIETYETLQREMQFDARGSRPSTTGVGHTGYLVFARR